jgi:hypothetical protein
MTVEITVEPTRNEHSVIFKLNRQVVRPGTGLSYSAPETAEDNPLAKSLFEIKGVASVWMISNEIQVTKDDKARWPSIKSKILETIRSS